jgi:hypothetical protein
MTTQDEPLTRTQLAGNIRAYALRVFWFNAKPDLPQALEEVRKLLISATAYEQSLSEIVEREPPWTQPREPG